MSTRVCGNREQASLTRTAEVTEARRKTLRVCGMTIDGSGRQILLWLASSQYHLGQSTWDTFGEHPPKASSSSCLSRGSSKGTRGCERDNSLARRRIF